MEQVPLSVFRERLVNVNTDSYFSLTASKVTELLESNYKISPILKNEIDALKKKNALTQEEKMILFILTSNIRIIELDRNMLTLKQRQLKESSNL